MDISGKRPTELDYGFPIKKKIGEKNHQQFIEKKNIFEWVWSFFVPCNLSTDLHRIVGCTPIPTYPIWEIPIKTPYIIYIYVGIYGL